MGMIFQYKSSCSLLLIVLIVSAFSCKKNWLEVKGNKTQTIPATLKDFQSLLDLTLIMNYNTYALGEVASDGHYISEAAWAAATSDGARNAYTWTYTLPYVNQSSWDFTYNRIFYCNLVLDGLPKVQISNQKEQQNWNNIKGQALFNRAEAFFHLAQIFSKSYNENTAATDLGIPLRLTSDITERTIRSTVKDTYDRIINDLKESQLLLPIDALYPTRGSLPASYALLARAYLVMEKYDSALKYADRSLQLKNTLMDYNNYNNSSSSYLGLFVPEVIFHTSMYTEDLSGFLTSDCFIDKDLYNLYSPNDLRKTVLFDDITFNEAIIFKGNYNNNTFDLFSGIATDEVYLMRAECYARKGDINSSMKDLNNLLRNRWKTGTFYDITASSIEDAVTKILEERKKELILRGIRWMDLKRLNRNSNFKLTITRSIGGATYKLAPNSYQYVFPIPDDIVALTGMKQNIGWND